MTDPATWDLALAILTGKGHKELAARRIIGIWVRDYEEQTVVDALMASSNKIDPVAYVQRILKTKKTKGRVIQDQLPLVPEQPPANPETIRAALQRSKEILRGRSFMQMHGRDISVESVLNSGSTFTLHLPKDGQD